MNLIQILINMGSPSLEGAEVEPCPPLLPSPAPVFVLPFSVLPAPHTSHTHPSSFHYLNYPLFAGFLALIRVTSLPQVLSRCFARSGGANPSRVSAANRPLRSTPPLHPSMFLQPSRDCAGLPLSTCPPSSSPFVPPLFPLRHLAESMLMFSYPTSCDAVPFCVIFCLADIHGDCPGHICVSGQRGDAQHSHRPGLATTTHHHTPPHTTPSTFKQCFTHPSTVPFFPTPLPIPSSLPPPSLSLVLFALTFLAGSSPSPSRPSPATLAHSPWPTARR
jgi:hypothetical protein